MAFGCFFVELSVAILALCPIIIRFLWSWHLLAWIEITTSCIIANIHGLSELHALLLPFGHLAHWFWSSSTSLNRLLIIFSERFRVLVLRLNFIHAICFSVFFGVECFTFLYKHLFTYFLMLLNWTWIKLAATWLTFNSGSVIILHLFYLLLGHIIWNRIWRGLHGSHFVNTHASLLLLKLFLLVIATSSTWVVLAVWFLCRL